MPFKSEYLVRGQVAEITPGKHKNVVKSKIPSFLNILLGRKRCSCEQMDNITAYFREDEQLPRRLNNVLRNFAHLRISVTSLVYQPYPPVHTQWALCSYRHSRGYKTAGEQKSHREKTNKRHMSCHSATFALQRGCFVPREWLAAKGLFCMVAHNCHSKTKNLTAKTKTSRQNQKPHGKNKIPHGKTKNLTAKPKYLTAKAKELWFCCGYLLLPLFGCRNRVSLLHSRF